MPGRKVNDRSCVACRRRVAKRALWRFVVVDGVLVWDKDQNRQARGAYIHPARECLERFGERKLWEQALRMASRRSKGGHRESSAGERPREGSLQQEQLHSLQIELERYLGPESAVPGTRIE